MPHADPEFLVDGPKKAAWTIALAHGAGAGMESPFMTAFARGLAGQGHRVMRFEFPYMAERRQGRKRPPDRETVLRETWLSVVRQLESEQSGERRLVIGGKSMGGRIASLVADEAAVAGLVCLGYPFHPVGKPDQLRVAHLEKIATPTLIVQGERDPFGNRQEIAVDRFSSAISIRWIADGDHSFKPRKRSGRTEGQNQQAALAEVQLFLESLGDG